MPNVGGLSGKSGEPWNQGIEAQLSCQKPGALREIRDGLLDAPWPAHSHEQDPRRPAGRRPPRPARPDVGQPPPPNSSKADSSPRPARPDVGQPPPPNSSKADSSPRPAEGRAPPGPRLT